MSSALILFDGVCNLCNGLVQFILKRDKENYFKFGSLQSQAAKRLIETFPNLNISGFDSVVLIENGIAYTKSDAGLRILKRLGGWWNFIQVFFIVPKFIRDVVYDFIARNRYQWFGKQDHCIIPTKEYADRFID